MTVSDGTHTRCSNIGNITNGRLPDKMVDPDWLKPYGISVREADANGTLLAYAPLSIEPDQTGGGKVAFRARMPYSTELGDRLAAGPEGAPRVDGSRRSPTNATSPTLCSRRTREGDASLADQERAAWCASHRTTDDLRVVQAYHDEWYLAGMSVREERSFDVAVAWQSPSSYSDYPGEDWLWQLARGLVTGFSSGRDCYSDDYNPTDYDPAAQPPVCNGDGKLDITVGAGGNTTIQDRFDGNLPDPLGTGTCPRPWSSRSSPPSPSRIVVAAQWLFANGFWYDIWVSFSEFALGFGLAIALGIPIGVALGWFPTLRAMFEPFVISLYSVPRVALLPLIILWLGIGTQSKVAVVFLGAVFPIIVNVMSGMRTAGRDAGQVRPAPSAPTTARCCGRSCCPAASRSMIAGMRLGAGRGLVGVVVGELVAAQAGVGHMMARAGATFQTDKVFVGVILLALFGLLLSKSLSALEARVDAWRPVRK